MKAEDYDFGFRVRVMKAIADGLPVDTIETALGIRINLLTLALLMQQKMRPHRAPTPKYDDIAHLQPGKSYRYSIKDYLDAVAIVRELNSQYAYFKPQPNGQWSLEKPKQRWVMVYGEPGWFEVKKIGAYTPINLNK